MALHEPSCLAFDCQSQFFSVALSPDGETVAAGMWSKVSLWSSQTGHKVVELNHAKRSSDPSMHFASVAFSPDTGAGVILAAGGTDGTINLWDASTCTSNQTPIGKLPGCSQRVGALAFTSDGKTLVSGGHDSTVRLWDMATRRPLLELNDFDLYHVSSVATSGMKIVTGSEDRIARVWDMATGVQLLQMKHSGDVRSVACLPDEAQGGPSSKIIATAGNWRSKKIYLWDTSSGQRIEELTGHAAALNSLAISQDGKYLVSLDFEGNIHLWDVSTRRSLRTLNAHSGYVFSVAISSDGKRVVSGGRDASHIWTF